MEQKKPGQYEKPIKPEPKSYNFNANNVEQELSKVRNQKQALDAELKQLNDRLVILNAKLSKVNELANVFEAVKAQAMKIDGLRSTLDGNGG